LGGHWEGGRNNLIVRGLDRTQASTGFEARCNRGSGITRHHQTLSLGRGSNSPHREPAWSTHSISRHSSHLHIGPGWLTLQFASSRGRSDNRSHRPPPRALNQRNAGESFPTPHRWATWIGPGRDSPTVSWFVLLAGNRGWRRPLVISVIRLRAQRPHRQNPSCARRRYQGHVMQSRKAGIGLILLGGFSCRPLAGQPRRWIAATRCPTAGRPTPSITIRTGGMSAGCQPQHGDNANGIPSRPHRAGGGENHSGG